MKIVVWLSEDAPPSQRAIARFLDGKRFLPTFVSAPTEEAVRAKAQAFWDAEREKYAKRDGRRPATVADAIIERQGQPDPVVEESPRHADDPVLNAALAEDAAKLEALGADAGPTLDDLDDLLG